MQGLVIASNYTNIITMTVKGLEGSFGLLLALVADLDFIYLLSANIPQISEN